MWLATGNCNFFEHWKQPFSYQIYGSTKKHSLPTVKSDSDKSCIANIILDQLLFSNSV